MTICHPLRWRSSLTYDETAEVVNASYARTRDIRQTAKETGNPVGLVMELVGVSDWIEFAEDSADS